MKKSQVLVILCNDDFTKQDVMDQVNSIMADNKLCRDLGMIKNFGGKILKPETNIYTAKKYVDEIEAIYAGVDNVNIKSVIDLDEQKALEDYEAEDFDALKKGQLDMLCKEHEDIFGDISYSTLKKSELVKAMALAVKGEAISDDSED